MSTVTVVISCVGEERGGGGDVFGGFFFFPKSNTDRVVASAEVSPCYICHVLALADISMCGGCTAAEHEESGSSVCATIPSVFPLF